MLVNSERTGMTTKLKAARTARGMNQTELAAASRLSATDISKFENLMARPYPAQAARLGKVLNLSPSELLEPVDDARAIGKR